MLQTGDGHRRLHVHPACPEDSCPTPHPKSVALPAWARHRPAPGARGGQGGVEAPPPPRPGRVPPLRRPHPDPRLPPPRAARAPLPRAWPGPLLPGPLLSLARPCPRPTAGGPGPRSAAAPRTYRPWPRGSGRRGRRQGAARGSGRCTGRGAAASQPRTGHFLPPRGCPAPPCGARPRAHPRAPAPRSGPPAPPGARAGAFVWERASLQFGAHVAN